MKLSKRFQAFTRLIQSPMAKEHYAYFQPIDRSFGTEVEVHGQRLIMAGSNDYLGLTHDPRVQEAAIQAIKRWGTGPGGSRFLSGNMTLHEELEARLAAFVGKKHVVVHTTGFLTNLGAISSLMQKDDVILFDKENHASIQEGCNNTGARIMYFEHNSRDSAERRLAQARESHPDSVCFLITEGVFSMSGDVANMPELIKIKRANPDLVFYLDDAHGLGVLGRGRGTAQHFGVAQDVDFIMGTFSKAMASTGGFIASDHEDALTYVKNNSKTLIFSAALAAANAATVLECLNILEAEPERVDRLWEITRKIRTGYREIGLEFGDNESPIIPIYVGDEFKALRISKELFKRGVFALPAIYPAVPKGKALIRTAYMSTHTDAQLDVVLTALGELAREFGIRVQDTQAAQAPVRDDNAGAMAAASS
ncbi:aminotransferase class I/II-fold pyridoxal phosphate-dependent enzyme [Megalodesulfovibrio gigas]|uniref:Putative 8-amino-7-oxononanoate synthase n=1 Tax=Megalodesulfovibrio gigas (strain ATCC 19364 / DSM 1382 / NCIMB 9332 / VKM B-1759) TaxID=1121448 RepID=T2GG19_MEGG1|nr:pyridoxal phosphate-dependent aminotransferase family protein [Megalodesulfovibrio gigas]AGW15106.1 putative 8-amino-7-oxononanoate synthase [Megalodesulfovibrio gigas DSM 1382 = ATCC 19364]